MTLRDAIHTIVCEQVGFITSRETPVLIKERPHMQVLVRTGTGRFRCAIQELDRRMKQVNADPQDYVRDVSLTSADYTAWANWLKS